MIRIKGLKELEDKILDLSDREAIDHIFLKRDLNQIKDELREIKELLSGNNGLHNDKNA